MNTPHTVLAELRALRSRIALYGHVGYLTQLDAAIEGLTAILPKTGEDRAREAEQVAAHERATEVACEEKDAGCPHRPKLSGAEILQAVRAGKTATPKNSPITGELVQIGEDETGFCRAVVKLDRATLRTIERLPMYRPVQIVENCDPLYGEITPPL